MVSLSLSPSLSLFIYFAKPVINIECLFGLFVCLSELLFGFFGAEQKVRETENVLSILNYCVGV